jgi:hypothetical protein
MAIRKPVSDDLARRDAARSPERPSFISDDDEAGDEIYGRAERAQRRTRSRQAAASMLSYYLEQSGSTLPEERRRMLEKAKNELGQG